MLCIQPLLVQDIPCINGHHIQFGCSSLEFYNAHCVRRATDSAMDAVVISNHRS